MDYSNNETKHETNQNNEEQINNLSRINSLKDELKENNKTTNKFLKYFLLFMYIIIVIICIFVYFEAQDFALPVVLLILSTIICGIPLLYIFVKDRINKKKNKDKNFKIENEIKEIEKKIEDHSNNDNITICKKCGHYTSNNGNCDYCSSHKKEKKSKLIMIIIYLLLMLGIIKACDLAFGKHFSNKDVLNYLNDQYVNENFEIISKKSISTTDSPHADCKKNHKEYVWTVRSIDTGIEFEVGEMYSMGAFICKYSDLTDNYFELYFASFINRLNDNRIIIKDQEIIINVEKFSSNEEIADFMIYIYKYANNDTEMKKLLSHGVDMHGHNTGNYFYYGILKNGEHIISVSLAKCESKSELLKLLNENNNY